jgi:hypothetical protein
MHYSRYEICSFNEIWEPTTLGRGVKDCDHKGPWRGMIIGALIGCDWIDDWKFQVIYSICLSYDHPNVILV